MKLIIVESPTKSNTISKFLSSDYRVLASYGHVRDLPKTKIGIDFEKNFEPQYLIPVKVRKNLNELKKEVAKADTIILATDEDREGEAIAWHLLKALELESPKTKNLKSKIVERIVFHEITKSAIFESLKNPRQININLVNAQIARRVLDRLVGYKLSPFLWKKVMSRLSAGRVQSVVLRLIVDREEEIRRFIAEEYWSVEVVFNTLGDNQFLAHLFKINGKVISRLDIKSKEKVDKIIADLRSLNFTVLKIEKKDVRKNPLPPYTTSTLQQEASNKFNFSAKQTMRLAQILYENGFITYMRTDSLNISKDSVAVAKNWLKENLGEKYTISAPRFFKAKSKLAQEAHEAIRPTFPNKTSDELPLKDGQEKKLYDLIWRRFIASQMPQAVFLASRLEIVGKSSQKTFGSSGNLKDGGSNEYIFNANGNTLIFDGFLKIWPSGFKEIELPLLKEKDNLILNKINVSRHFTEPPSRYNEASLIKALEKYGIGRPSTYVPILSTIQSRNYVVKNEARRFELTKIGETVGKILIENFKDIMDIKFTADMENNLDEIAKGSRQWQEVIGEFYSSFIKNLEAKYDSQKKIDLDEQTDEICQKCHKPMVIKFGRFGKFLACTGFPECKNTKSIIMPLGVKCPRCGYQIVEKKSKRGKVFYGCSNYPNCNFALWLKPLNELCPKCESLLVVFGKTLKIKCSNKECDYKRYGSRDTEL